MGKKWIKQEEIIALLKTEEWEIINFTTMDGGCFMTNNKGKTIDIHSKTFWAIRNKGLLKHISGIFPSETYVLKKP